MQSQTEKLNEEIEKKNDRISPVRFLCVAVFILATTNGFFCNFTSRQRRRQKITIQAKYEASKEG